MIGDVKILNHCDNCSIFVNENEILTNIVA